MKVPSALILTIAALAVCLISSCSIVPANSTGNEPGQEKSLLATGFQGHVYEYLPNGSIGNIVANTQIIFTRNDGYQYPVSSDASGLYKVSLTPGSYPVSATAPGHFAYYNAAFVTTTGTYSTGNIFMHKYSGSRGFAYDASTGATLANVTISYYYQATWA